jgi:hypothetical protein
MDTSIGCDLCLYRQQDIALWHGYGKIFPKQNKFQTLIRLYLFWEIRPIRNPKLDHLVLAASTLGLNFLFLDPMVPCLPFSCLKHLWIVKSSSLPPSLTCPETAKIRLSYLVFMPKPCTHRMHDPRLIVPHIRPKVFTDNQMSWIKYYYYISSVSKDYDDSQRNRIAEDSITPQEWQPGQHVA